MENTNHSPWTANVGINIHDQAIIYTEESGQSVAVTYQGAEDAELICKAVNNHQALVDALQKAKSLIADLDGFCKSLDQDDLGDKCEEMFFDLNSLLKSLNH